MGNDQRVGLYDAENPESSHKNGMFSLTRNVPKFGLINHKYLITLKSKRDMD